MYGLSLLDFKSWVQISRSENVLILCLDICLDISKIAITVEEIDCCCTIHDICKSEAICLLETSVLDDCEYIYIYIYI